MSPEPPFPTAAGFDLGRHFAGAVVAHDPRHGYILLEVFEADSKKDLLTIQEVLVALPPVSVVGCEQLFHSPGKPTAFRAEEMVGVVRLFCAQRGLPDPVRLLPNWVKETFTGDPQSSKERVRRFAVRRFPHRWTKNYQGVRMIVPIHWEPVRGKGGFSDHATDAVAIAYSTLVAEEGCRKRLNVRGRGEETTCGRTPISHSTITAKRVQLPCGFGECKRALKRQIREGAP